MSKPELVYGRHAARALVERDLAGVLEIWLQDGRDDAWLRSVVAQAQAAGIHVERVPRRTLDRKLPGVRHQGIVVRYRASEAGAGSPSMAFEDLLEDVRPRSLVLALDGVEDPRNLGACLRSAAAAGARAVIAPRSRGAPLTAAARKAAAGAAEAVPFVQVPNLARALGQLGDAGYARVGAAGDAGVELWDANLSGAVVLVLGGEHGGLRRLSREACDQLVRIPMAPTSRGLDSLNVSVAAGVCLFEWARQNRG